MGIFGFLTERDWSQKSYHGNNTKGAICFFCDGHLSFVPDCWSKGAKTLGGRVVLVDRAEKRLRMSSIRAGKLGMTR